MKNEIWVICEIKEKKISRASKELISKAKQLSLKKDLSVASVIISEADKSEIHVLANLGSDKLYKYSCDIPSGYSEDIEAEIITHYARLYGPEIILIPATISGRSLAPKIAMALKTGLTADCTDLSFNDKGLLIQTRAAYSGNIFAEILCAEKRPQMATVRPGVFQVVKTSKEPAYHCQVKSWDFKPTNKNEIELIERITRKRESIPVESAEIIVAGGAGMGSMEGFQKLTQLSKLLGGTTAASRAAVNAGYAPYEKQVGQTGKTIRPKLYIACGISGSVQHLAGMSSSEFIVAINSDPKSPIFTYL